MSEKKQPNLLLLFLSIGLILLITTVLFAIGAKAHFNDWKESGVFGDTFGALNAIFSGLAFAGVIVTILLQKTELENQRIELGLQREEMKETRKEFLLNRATNLIYKQLERFERSMDELEIEYNPNLTYYGSSAFVYLNSILEHIRDDYMHLEAAEQEANRNHLKKNLQFLTNYQKKIERFSFNAYNSVEVLKRIIYKTDLNIDELNDLKNLFYINIGFITMGTIEKISICDKLELDILKAEDYSYRLEVGAMKKSNIFLRSLIDFYKIRLTEDNFETHKTKWLESIGQNEK